MYLGIDAGGTHTDAVCIQGGRVAGAAKVITDHDDLPGSVAAVLAALPASLDLRRVRRVTLGTTLAVNALVQGRADPVGLALSAGPGMAAARFGLGGHVHVTPGGLDHRGVEVAPLDRESLRQAARAWEREGIRAFAVAGKFSPRNPAHERAMAEILMPLGQVTQGHQLSGQLNFPRRIAGAWYNSAVWRLHNAFLDAVEAALRGAGISAPARLLKADGGAVPLAASRNHPVASILSGPAASVMGVMALCDVQDDCLLLDMGGTTTDMALYAAGSPVLDRDGMRLSMGGAAGTGRSTPVRALAAQSLGIGGDSLISVREGSVSVGPWRDGPAMAFGGARPALLDALNVLGTAGSAGQAGLSRQGMESLAREHGLSAAALAREAAQAAMQTIACGVRDLLAHVNGRPVYTLAALLGDRPIRPVRAWLVGGPADMARDLLQQALGMPVSVPGCAAVANAVGAAMTLPTAELELLADTVQGVARVPALDWERPITRQYTLDMARHDALTLLREHMARSGADGPDTFDGPAGHEPDGPQDGAQEVEVLEEGMFATLDDRGRGGRDIRVRCQLVPGIVRRVTC